MSETSVHPLIPVFTQLASCIQLWIDNGRDPQRVLSLMANWLSSPQADLGNQSTLSILSLTDDTSSAPPTAPSLPQEELWLLCTSFDTAFALLAGQVKELAAKVNGSGPPL